MQRIAAVLAAGGGVLLLTWMVSPAASAPTRTDPPRTAFHPDQSSAVVAEVNTQVERLRERLDTVPSFPPPSRDPFNFGRRAEPRPPVVSNPTPPVPAIVEAPPGPVLPHLVAIVASDEDGGVVRSAVISENDDVRFLKPGERWQPGFAQRRLCRDAVDRRPRYVHACSLTPPRSVRGFADPVGFWLPRSLPT